MKLNMTCSITLPSGATVEMTPKEVLDFHDELTKFINENWEALKEKE